MPTFTRSISELVADGFDFGLDAADYPIFDESYRDALNTKIIRHYWNYEIGHETESMFRFSLNRKMSEIMPYYNQLYLSTKIDFDPLGTMKYSDVMDGIGHLSGSNSDTEHAETSTTKDDTGSSTSHNTNTTETDSQSRGVHSDFPQVALSGDQDYATSMDDATSKSTATGSQDGTGSTTGHSESADTIDRNGSGTTAEDTTAHNTRDVQGFQGVPASQLLMMYRSSLINIDMMVIKDLGSLFMGLWDNGDEFSGQSGIGFGYGYI